MPNIGWLPGWFKEYLKILIEQELTGNTLASKFKENFLRRQELYFEGIA